MKIVVFFNLLFTFKANNYLAITTTHQLYKQTQKRKKKFTQTNKKINKERISKIKNAKIASIKFIKLNAKFTNR